MGKSCLVVTNLTLEHIMNEDELKRRLKLFALRILKLVAALPRTIAGKVIDNLPEPELLSRRTIGRRVERGQKLNSFHVWE